VNKKSAISSFSGIAALTILSSLLLLAASLLPPLGILFYFFLKSPLILITLGNGFKIGLLAFGLIAALVVPLSHGHYNLPYLVEYGLVAIIMAQALRYKVSFNKIIILCAVVSGAIALIYLAINPPLGADSLAEVPSRLIAQMRADMGRFASQGGMDPRQLRGMGQLTAVIEAVLSRAFPALILSGAAMGALLNYLAAKKISRGFTGLGSLNPRTLSTWSAPEYCVWFFILGGLMTIIPLGYTRTIGLNVVVVMLVIYFLQGLAITSFFFQKWELSQLFRIPIYVFVFFNIFLSLLLACVGLFDLWGDFRRLRKAREDA
jgi:uncharacterized protein YybS (DUF2232 family)